jgi:putative flippase GtrA
VTQAKPTGDGKRFWTFLLVGGLAALVNWGSRIVISAGGVPFEVAVVLAYILGMITAYLLSRTFVFEKSDRSVSSEVWRFTLVNLLALAVVWVVSVGLEGWLLPAIGWTWRRPEVAHAIGVASPVVTSYLGHRHFTFRRKADDRTHERKS